MVVPLQRRGLRARTFSTGWERLAKMPLPGIVALKDGNFLIVGKVGDRKALVQSPGNPKPEIMEQAAFEAVWNGQIVLMTRRAALGDLHRRFNLSWFLAAIKKYRHLLSEVFVASFFLQLFALVTPIFFQVIIDKVLVHRGISTLMVIVIGMAKKSCPAAAQRLCSRSRPGSCARSMSRMDRPSKPEKF
jgi:subfamily B ATP-binding cassette protein HlyB/CyaB